jgi:microcystin-dependent protein
LGETLNTLNEAKLPSLTKTLNITTNATTNAKYDNGNFEVVAGTGVLVPAASAMNPASVVAGSTGTVSFGGGGAHNNTPRVMTGTFYQKL